MIGFGELARKAAEWRIDLGSAERAYALDFLLAGLFSRPALHSRLALSGSLALAKAYLRTYPPVVEGDLITEGQPDTGLEAELAAATGKWSEKGGPSLHLTAWKGSEARFEFAGPLGRRSAAQPHLVVRLLARRMRLPPVERPIIHSFSDALDAAVRAVALEELAAERIAELGGRPRARDLFDLWAVLKHAEPFDLGQAKGLAADVAQEKGKPLAEGIAPSYRPFLERAWENALKNVQPHPPFQQAEAEIKQKLGFSD